MTIRAVWLQLKKLETWARLHTVSNTWMQYLLVKLYVKTFRKLHPACFKSENFFSASSISRKVNFACNDGKTNQFPQIFATALFLVKTKPTFSCTVEPFHSGCCNDLQETVQKSFSFPFLSCYSFIISLPTLVLLFKMLWYGVTRWAPQVAYICLNRGRLCVVTLDQVVK